MSKDYTQSCEIFEHYTALNLKYHYYIKYYSRIRPEVVENTKSKFDIIAENNKRLTLDHILDQKSLRIIPGTHFPRDILKEMCSGWDYKEKRSYDTADLIIVDTAPINFRVRQQQSTIGGVTHSFEKCEDYPSAQDIKTMKGLLEIEDKNMHKVFSKKALWNAIHDLEEATKNDFSRLFFGAMSKDSHSLKLISTELCKVTLSDLDQYIILCLLEGNYMFSSSKSKIYKLFANQFYSYGLINIQFRDNKIYLDSVRRLLNSGLDSKDSYFIEMIKSGEVPIVELGFDYGSFDLKIVEKEKKHYEDTTVETKTDWTV